MCTILIWACESSTFLPSSNKMKERIEAPWKVEIKPYSDTETLPQQWFFASDLFYVTRLDQSGTIDTLYKGSYSISTTLANAYIVLSGITPINKTLDAQWTILDLDTDIMRISRKGGSGGGLVMYEFSKVK